MVRIKNRYLLIELVPPTARQAGPGDLLRTIRNSLLTHFGEVGAGRSSPSLSFKSFSADTQSGLLRVNRGDLREVWASVSLVTALSGKPAALKVSHVGGTIRSCRKRTIEINRRILSRAKR